MTRDQWLERCGKRLMEAGDVEPGEAAAMAKDAADYQRQKNGRNPAQWEPPESAAGEVIAAW